MAKVIRVLLIAKSPLHGLDEPVTISYNADDGGITTPTELPAHIVERLNQWALVVVQGVADHTNPLFHKPMMTDKQSAFDLEVKLDDWTLHVITTTPIRTHHETTHKISASGSHNSICLGLAAIFSNVKRS